MKDALAGFAMGFLVGMATLLGLGVYLHRTPHHYLQVIEPPFKASGVSLGTGKEELEKIRRLLNPCIVDGPLPDECKKYVVNGILVQPPIRIIVDTSK